MDWLVPNIEKLLNTTNMDLLKSYLPTISAGYFLVKNKVSIKKNRTPEALIKSTHILLVKSFSLSLPNNLFKIVLNKIYV